MKEKGFSLVETLIVILIIVVLGFLLSDLLFRTFRGGHRTDLGGNIKQNGQNALTEMDTTIRTSDAIVCTGNWSSWSGVNPADTIAIVSKGVYTRFRFYPPVGGSTPANGYLAKDNPTLTDPSQYGSLCSSPGGTPAPLPQSSSTGVTNVTDINLVSGVSVVGTGSNAFFTRTSVAGFKDSVMINFNLGPAPNAGSSSDAMVSQNNQINFQTTIGIR